MPGPKSSLEPETPPLLLQPGTIIDGRYQIVAPVGAGGMGSVFEAVNIKIRRRVAIKVLKPELAKREASVRRFLREARAASVVSHRNVVDIHDFGEWDGLVYYAMELLRGRDLSQALAEVGRMRWPTARPILLQTVRALKAAHDAGVIHRDIKPGNVFLVDASDDEPERVKVLDFGIARTHASAATQLTGNGDLMGTAWYMAPELAKGATADPRTEVYAFGILAYQVMAGRVPFDDLDSFRVLLRHTNEAPRRLGTLAPDVPDTVLAVVERCLAKNAEQRYQTMRELEHALSSIGPQGEAVEPSTRPPPAVAPNRDPVDLSEVVTKPRATAVLGAGPVGEPLPATDLLAPPSPDDDPDEEATTLARVARLPDRTEKVGPPPGGSTEVALPQVPSPGSRPTTEVAPARPVAAARPVRPQAQDRWVLLLLVGGVLALALGGLVAAMLARG